MPFSGFRRLNGDLVGLVAASAIAGFQRFWKARRDQRAETWPISYGRIDRVSVDTDSQRSKFKCYYTYRVGSESFVGSFEKTFSDADEAHTWASALDRQQVPVRYDPSAPDRSRLREADLPPIVQTAPLHSPGTPAFGTSGPDRLLISALLVVSLLGLALSVTSLIQEFTGKTLVPLTVAQWAGYCAFPIFMIAMWLRKARKSTKAPEWMKYLNYALLYYAVFSTILPSAPNQGHFIHGWNAIDARYNLFLYFSAFEWCYASLPEGEANAPNEFPTFVAPPSEQIGHERDPFS